MKREPLHIQIGDHRTTLESDGKQVFDETGAVPFDAFPLGPGRYSVLFRGRSRTVIVEQRTGSSATLRTADGRRTVQWKDRRAVQLEAMGFDTSADNAEREVRAPMPGLVLDVLVTPGQEVSVGNGLVVLEAMKMENELRAASAGTVAAVHVASGEAVAKDALLIEIQS